MVQEVMREQRHRFWRWWDDAQPRGTQFSRAGGCAPRRHCFCHYFMLLALCRHRSRLFPPCEFSHFCGTHQFHSDLSAARAGSSTCRLPTCTA